MMRNNSYFPATDKEGNHYEGWSPAQENCKVIQEIPCKYPSEENHNSAYHEYLDNLAQVNKDHEARRIERENEETWDAMNPYPDSEVVYVK